MASAAEMSRGVAGITASALGKPPLVPRRTSPPAAFEREVLVGVSDTAASGASGTGLVPSGAASKASGAASKASEAAAMASGAAAMANRVLGEAYSSSSSSGAALGSSNTESVANETESLPNDEESLENETNGNSNGENDDIGESIPFEEFKGDCLGRTYCVNKSPDGGYFFDYAVPPEGFDFNDIKYFRVKGSTLAEVETELRKIVGIESNISSTAGVPNNNNDNNNSGAPFGTLRDKKQVGGTGVYVVWNDYILIQRRSLTVGSYTGTITTPGGSVDKSDTSVKSAALRELREESQFEVNGEELKPESLELLHQEKNKSGLFTVSFLVLLKDTDVPAVIGPDTAHENEVLKFNKSEDASLFALPHKPTISPYYIWVRRKELQDWLFNPSNKKYVVGADEKKNPFRHTLAKLNARLGDPGPYVAPNENENGGAAAAASSTSSSSAAASSAFSSSAEALRSAAGLGLGTAGLGRVGVTTGGPSTSAALSSSSGVPSGRTSRLIPEPAKALPLRGVDFSRFKGGKQTTRKNRKDKK
jgi:8-oxo-dGTP pyrophosphatase MutT (NUDIX family)